MYSQLIKDIKSGLTISLVFVISIGIFGTVFAAISHVNGGDPLTSTKWNELVDSINGHTTSITTINSTISGLSNAPTGMISAFSLTSCPTGWIAADGTNSTPDLRGQFIRGINNFGSAAGTRSDGKQDPDGLRAINSYQADAFKSHNHTLYYQRNFAGVAAGSMGGRAVNNRLPNLGAPGYGSPWYREDSDDMPMRGGNETRGKNVGLIYCVKN